MLDDANDRNFELVSGLLGEQVASSFMLLRVIMFGVVLVVTALNLRAVPRILPFFSNPKMSHALPILAVVSTAVVVFSTIFEMFLSHDSLGVEGETSSPIGTVRDGLWWVTYPMSGWLLAIAVPVLIASALSIVAIATRDQ